MGPPKFSVMLKAHSARWRGSDSEPERQTEPEKGLGTTVNQSHRDEGTRPPSQRVHPPPRKATHGRRHPLPTPRDPTVSPLTVAGRLAT